MGYRCGLQVWAIGGGYSGGYRQGLQWGLQAEATGGAYRQGLQAGATGVGYKCELQLVLL